MELHNYKMQILRELLMNEASRFTDLNIKDLTSDHFSYHIKSLIEMGLVCKTPEGLYELTEKVKSLQGA